MGAFGVWLSTVPEVARKVIPLSGFVLAFISLFWVLPELAHEFGWAPGAALMTSGFLILFLIDRYVSPVCPTCSHTHDHASCSTSLHGFATPLIAAAMLHSLFDGWALVAGGESGIGELGRAISAGVILHKLPEAVSFGVIVKAAIPSRNRAYAWVTVTPAAMFLGGMLAMATAGHTSIRFISILLAMAGGTFLCLGFHAIHGEWKRRMHSEHQA
jgi:hypothetical protein